MKRIIHPNWLFVWIITGGDGHCPHEYEENDIQDDTEYGGTHICLLCGATMKYDVSDIGD
jgi:hypothetical protein